MTTATVKAIARHYDALTPEERFRLVLAASARGDETDRDRLSRAGERHGLRLPEHAPYALAFQEVALLTLLDLVDAAGVFLEAHARSLDMAKAAGAALRAKAAGWDAFCSRLGVPARLLWADLPGAKRIEQALMLADGLPVDGDGTAAKSADAIASAFRARVRWWSGER